MECVTCSKGRAGPGRAFGAEETDGYKKASRECEVVPRTRVHCMCIGKICLCVIGVDRPR